MRKSGPLPAIVALAMLSLAGAAHADNDWLARLNQYRAMAQLAPVARDDHLAAGEAAFAQYLVKNYSVAIRNHEPLGPEKYIENPTNPWFSYDGFVAGRSSNAAAVGVLKTTDVIDSWMADPIERLPLLVPFLTNVAYASFCEGNVCAVALYSKAHSRSVSIYASEGGREAPLSFAKAIEFPPNGSTMDVASVGHLSQRLAAACSGFKTPTGLPLTLQFGRWISPKIRSGSLSFDGKGVSACAFDATNYRNSDEFSQKVGRGRLEEFGAVVIVPRFPLRPSTKYTVHVLVNAHTYDWSFSTSTSALAMP
jgi:hypothetical protein